MFRGRVARLLGVLVLSFSLPAAMASASTVTRPKAHASAMTPAWMGARLWLADALRKSGCLLGVPGLCHPGNGTNPASDFGCSVDPWGIPRCNSSSSAPAEAENG